MEVEKTSPGWLPAGEFERQTEEVVGFFLDLPFEDQKSLLLMAASEIVPRLTDLTRDEFINQLRHVPPSDGVLPNQVDEQAETRDEVYEDWVRQSPAVQRNVLELVGPRIVVNLQGPERDRFLLQLRQAIGDVDNQPTIH